MKAENYCRRAKKESLTAEGWDTQGLGETSSVSTPLVWSCVRESMRQPWETSTNRMKCQRKSAPRMGFLTSMMRKIQWKVQQNLRLRVWDVVPKVAILELLATWSGRPVGREEQENWEAGRMLTSGPVSTRKCSPLICSVTKKNRQLWERPVALANSGWLIRFPGRCRGGSTCGPGLQIADGASNKGRTWMNVMRIARLDVRSRTGAGVWKNPRRKVG